MKNYKAYLAIAVIFLLNPFYALADDIQIIKNLFKNANQVISENKAKTILLYTTPDSLQDPNKWNKVIDKKSEKTFKESSVKANIYLHDNKVIKALIILNDESGDWEAQNEYYFYKNGVTAFIFQKHITFQGYDTDHDKNLLPGPYILEKRIYFDDNGKKIKSLEKAYISKSNQPINPKYLQLIDIDEYDSMKKLPFYNLIEKYLKK